ncbi:MAG: methyltransferase domain-containing protein [Bacteroidota bacterium]|nr:methyltransferase domain-containing protein [Bacteroidota bacterium]
MLFLPEKIENMFWEYRLGIITRGLAGVDTADDEHIHYGTVPYRTINTILDHLQLTHSDVFVDLGCGKGRVLCCAAMRSIEKSIGVECSPSLSSIAQHNADVLRFHHSPIAVLTMEAQQFDYSVGTVYYLFHPFGPETLSTVLEQLRSGVERIPRSVRIVYVNPVHNNVLKDCSWLIETEKWNAGESRSPVHPVTWWQNKIDRQG